ncbi:MAG: hypothetical protein M3134_07120 [Actinomycetota bacterium]|nr:hypothetical protein [Actinomycetota bacterium]
MRRRALRLLAVAMTLGFVALPAAPAFALRDEPPVLITAWYWEDQKRQRIQDPTTGTDVAVISVPNPFCPSAPIVGSPSPESCKQGRLPIQVREGDYETPNQLSAIGFDFALVPPGSKIGKFTVTLVEASDQQSEPVNAEGKSLQACFIEEFFGDGEASLYTEVPKYTCSETDPVAPRKELKLKDEGGEGGNDPQPPEQEDATFGYTFDLTEFARTWVDEGTPMTAVMLTPVRPKEAEYDPATDANWRTVLVGAVEENGVKTSLTYTPPPTPEIPEDPEDPADPGTPFDSGTSTTTTTGGGSIPSSSGSVDTPTAPTTTGSTEVPTDLAAEATDTASDVVPKGWPGYVWLGILAGIVGLSMVRSVVLERTVGIRPDGVLAHIRRLNASRRGVELATAGEAAVGAGAVASIVAGLKSLGEKTGGIAGKLNFRKKGGS